jgi:hypothetical protein
VVVGKFSLGGRALEVICRRVLVLYVGIFLLQRKSLGCAERFALQQSHVVHPLRGRSLVKQVRCPPAIAMSGITCPITGPSTQVTQSGFK